MIERAGTSADDVTVACVTYLPAERRLRWASAGHPPGLRLDDGRELVSPGQGGSPPAISATTCACSWPASGSRRSDT
jgi:hypothetical protein